MKEKTEAKRYAYACKRCTYVWMSRKLAEEIRACPSCKSTQWNRDDVCKKCGSIKRKERKKNDKI